VKERALCGAVILICDSVSFVLRQQKSWAEPSES
jgi:hypothetical protein